VGVLIWLAGSAVAFVAGRFADFGRFNAFAEALVVACSGLTAGLIATGLDFGGFAEPDLRAFLFATFVSALALALTRLAALALRWPSSQRRDS
jgi:hypothetical protein